MSTSSQVPQVTWDDQPQVKWDDQAATAPPDLGPLAVSHRPVPPPQAKPTPAQELGIPAPPNPILTGPEAQMQDQDWLQRLGAAGLAAGSNAPLEVSTKDQGPERAAIAKNAEEHVTGASGYPKMAEAVRKYRGAEGYADQNKARTEAGTEFLQGAAEAATPAMLALGPAAPLRTALGLGEGYLASKAAGAVADTMGASPATKDFVKTAGWFIPNALTQARNASEILDAALPRGFVSPEGNAVAGEALGGKVQAGVARTPEGIKVAGRVGPFKGGFTVPGTRPAPEVPGIEPPTIQGEPAAKPPAPPPMPAEVADAARAAGVKAEAEAQSARVARGMTPTPQPPPPPPPPMVNDETVAAVGAAIQSLPKEQQPAVILEATQRAAESILHHGGAVVDGEVHTATTPQEALRVAKKVMDAQIAKADEASNKPLTPEQLTAELAKLTRYAAVRQEEHNSGDYSAAKQRFEEAKAKAEALVAKADDDTLLKTMAGSNRRAIEDGTERLAPADDRGVNDWAAMEYMRRHPEAVAKNEARLAEFARARAEAEAQPQPPAGFEVEDHRMSERRSQTEPVTEEQRQGERRVSEMSPAELQEAALGDYKTGGLFRNERAWNEREKQPHTAITDVDGLGAVNDKFGHEAGDSLIKAYGQAFKDAGLTAYRTGGDEVRLQGEHKEQLQSSLEKARELLRNSPIKFTAPDGRSITLKGVDFSYGIGPDERSSDRALYEHKNQRAAAGERPKQKGELPRGIQQTPEVRGHQELQGVRGEHGPGTGRNENAGGERSGGNAEAPQVAESPNRQKFREAYTRHLTKAVQEHPQEYSYGVQAVPRVVERMVNSLAKGTANTQSRAIKAAAKELGIKPTKAALQGYLTAKAETKATETKPPITETKAPAAETKPAKAETPAFKEGDKVRWTDKTGNVQHGQVVDADAKSATVEKFVGNGSYELSGRVENVKVENIQKLERPADNGAENITPAENLTPEVKPQVQPPEGFEVEPKHKFGNTQVRVPTDLSSEIEELGDKIPTADLMGDGRESGFHVTLKYGLHAPDQAVMQLREALADEPAIHVTLGEIESFPPSEHSDNAAPIVVRLSGASMLKLRQLKNSIAKYVDAEPDSFPDYKPHITIAYVKPDRAQAVIDMLGADAVSGRTFTIDRILVTDRGGNAEVVKLGSAENLSPESQNSPTIEPESANEPPSPRTAGEAENVPRVSEPPGESGNAPATVPPEGEQEPEGEGNIQPGAGRENPKRVERPGRRSRGGVSSKRSGGSGTTEHPAPERVGADGKPVTEPTPEEPEEAATTAAALRNQNNYRISDEYADKIGSGGEITKIKGNLDALETLKNIQKEGREIATPDEQQTLAKYVDFGGLVGMLERPYDRQYADHYDRFQKLLTPEEIQEIKETLPNTHYTSMQMVDWHWRALQRLGFRGGRIGEFGMGIGNYYGRIPQKISDRSDLYGVERNPLTGSMAKLLYPDAKIVVKPFQQFQVPDGSFDLVIGNVPFQDFDITDDPRYAKLRLNLHNYFIVKSLDKVRPGGVVAVITSRYTMDSVGAKGVRAREEMAKRGDLLAAVRLPDKAFKGNAGTEVVADLLIFRKRSPSDILEKMPDWTKTGEVTVPAMSKEVKLSYGGTTTRSLPEKTFHINQYFIENPENVLGSHSQAGTMYGPGQYTVKAPEDFAAALDGAMEKIPEKAFGKVKGKQPTQAAADIAPEGMTFAPETVKPGAYYIDEKGNVKVKQNGIGVDLPPSLRTRQAIDHIKAAIGLRDQLNNLIDLELASTDDEPLKADRDKLGRLYDAYRLKYGSLHGPKLKEVFGDDPEYPKLQALENIDPETKTVSKAAILTKRVLAPYDPLRELPSDPKAAMLKVLAARGYLDTKLMADLLNEPEQQIVDRLEKNNLIFQDPETGRYHTADEYLSGNVRDKLRLARNAADTDPKYERNVKELEKVQPAKRTIHQVRPQLGATWIPTELYEQFVAHLMGVHKNSINISRNLDGRWLVQGPSQGQKRNWDGGGISAHKLVQYGLNQQQPTVWINHSDGTRSVDAASTAGARDKLEAIKEEFRTVLRKAPEKTIEQLENIYNQTYNAYRRREFDGEHLDFPGMAQDWANKIRGYQKAFVWRTLQEGRAGLFHAPGLGKTLTMITAGQEAIRLKLSKKNLYAVPNNMIPQWREDFKKSYPNSNVLAVQDEDFTPQNRNKLLSRIATGDWDAVLLAHSQFDRLAMSPEYEMEGIQERVRELREVMADLDPKDDKKTIKQMEKAVDKLEARLNLLNNKPKDKSITFDKMGFGMMFVDEAHAYKAMQVPTRMGNIKGISRRASQRAFALELKANYMRKTHGGRGVILATGTPLTNTIGEVYILTKYLAPELLQEAGIRNFDDWAAQFANPVTTWEYAPDGVTFRPTTALSQFVNIKELQAQFQRFSEYLSTKDAVVMAGLKLPDVHRKDVTLQITDTQEPLLQMIADRGAALIKHPPRTPEEMREDNWLKLSSHARAISLDPRLYDPRAKDDPNSKVNKAVDLVKSLLDETEANHGTVALFSDFFAHHNGAGKVDFDLFEDIRKKLVAKGVPRKEIASVYDAGDNKEAKEAMFAAVRSGKIRVIMGSTDKLGIGVNIQDRLRAMMHLDQPWRPDQVEQREARGIRSGNMYAEEKHGGKVSVYRFIGEPKPGKVKVFDPETETEVEKERPRAYDLQMYQQLERKAMSQEQFLSGKFDGDVLEDTAGDVRLNSQMYAMGKAMSTGNPDAIRKLKLDHEIRTKELLQSNFEAEHSQYRYELTRAQRYLSQNKVTLEQASTFLDKWKESTKDLEVERTKQLDALNKQIEKVKAQADALEPERQKLKKVWDKSDAEGKARLQKEFEEDPKFAPYHKLDDLRKEYKTLEDAGIPPPVKFGDYPVLNTKEERVEFYKQHPDMAEFVGKPIIVGGIPTTIKAEPTMVKVKGKAVEITELHYRFPGEYDNWHKLPFNEQAQRSLPGAFLNSISQRARGLDGLVSGSRYAIERYTREIANLQTEVDRKSPYEAELEAMRREMREIDERLGRVDSHITAAPEDEGAVVDENEGEEEAVQGTEPNEGEEEEGGDNGNRFGSQRGAASLGAILSPVTIPLELVRKANAAYDNFIKGVIDRKLQIGDKYWKVAAKDPAIASLLHEVDNAPRYFREKAATNIANVTKGLNERQIRQAAMMADSDARSYLEDAHPDEFEEATNDPDVTDAVARFKPFQKELSDWREALGWPVRKSMYVEENTETDDPDKRWMVMDNDGNQVDAFKSPAKAADYVEANAKVEDHLRRTYPEHMRQPLPAETEPGPYTGVFHEAGLRPPRMDKKQRLASAQYFYEHGAKDFSGYIESYRMAREAILKQGIYDTLTESGTPWKAGTAKPSSIKYDGKTYYRPDIATKMAEGGEKNVPTYQVYDPSRGERFLVRGIPNDEGVGGWSTLSTGKPGIGPNDRWLAPREVVEALENYDKTRGGEGAGSLRRFFQTQIVGLFGPAVHISNIVRRIGQTTGMGTFDPRSWSHITRLILSKSLRERALQGVDDATVDMLTKYGAYTDWHDIFNAKQYIAGNLNPLNWNKFGKGILFDPKFAKGWGGLDPKARVVVADYLKEHVPGITDQEIASQVNDAFGDYNRANWTDRQRMLSKFILFPGWDFASAKWFLRHPLITGVLGALAVLAVNLVLNKMGLNKDQDSRDLASIHIRNRQYRPGALVDSFGSHMAQPVLRPLQKALEGGDRGEVAAAAGEGVIRAGASLANVLRPDLQLAMEEIANRRYMGAGKEIATDDDAHTPGTVLPNRALEKRAVFAAVKAFPAINRFLDLDQNVDLASGIGSVFGVMNSKHGAEERLRANEAKAYGYSQTLQKLAELNPKEAEKFVDDPNKAVYLVFNSDLSQMVKDLKEIDADTAEVVKAKGITGEERKQALANLKQAREQALKAADSLNDALFAAKKNQATEQKPEAEAKPKQISKGDTVTLRDGSRGEVAYVHPQMSIARVRAGGRTRTVNLKEIQNG